MKIYIHQKIPLYTNVLWKILKEMGISDHLTCLLRNLYAGQEATVRTGHGQVRCTILDAWGWCTGTTQRDGMGREEGGGFRIPEILVVPREKTPTGAAARGNP